MDTNRGFCCKVSIVAMAVTICMIATACGGSDSTAASGSAHASALSEGQVRSVLMSLPYRYTFREVPIPPGASGAVAGQIHGPRHTDLAFSITLGTGVNPVPVSESGDENVIGVPVAGFTINANTMAKVGPHKWGPSREVSGPGQADVAETMVFHIEESLCKAALHEPCPV
jgi:hypothetical protein